MDMVVQVRYNFPLLEFDEELAKYEQVALKNINRGTAICVRDGAKVVGVLIFLINQKCLSCMAVHPDYRRRSIASAMIKKMLGALPQDEDIWVTTFREDDEKGAAPWALYKSFGFVPDELIIERDYPHQKFVLHKNS